MKIGIVGHGSDKFSQLNKGCAFQIISDILECSKNPILVSGHSPVGGIDIWAEYIASKLNIPMDIKTPKSNSWDGLYGYKARNLDIARTSDIVHIILVNEYPENYIGQKFKLCYHCVKYPDMTLSHVKSGGCWTGWEAHKLGKSIVFHVISDGTEQSLLF